MSTNNKTENETTHDKKDSEESSDEEEEEIITYSPFDEEIKPSLKYNEQRRIKTITHYYKERDTGYTSVPQERLELIDGTGYNADIGRALICNFYNKDEGIIFLISFFFKYGMDKFKFISLKSAHLLSLFLNNYLNFIFKEDFFEKIKIYLLENIENSEIAKPYKTNFIVTEINNIIIENIKNTNVKQESLQKLNQLMIDSLPKIFKNMTIKKEFIDRKCKDNRIKVFLEKVLVKNPNSTMTTDNFSNYFFYILKYKIKSTDSKLAQSDIFSHFLIYYLQVIDTAVNYFLDLFIEKKNSLFSYEIFNLFNNDWKDFFYKDYNNHWKWTFEIPDTLQNWFTTFNEQKITKTLEVTTLQSTIKSTSVKLNDLPTELLVEIFCNLPLLSVGELLNLRLICKLWNNLIVTPNLLNNQMLWIQLIYNTILRCYLFPYCKSYTKTFTISFLMEIITNQQQENNKQNNNNKIDGFKAWKENIGNVFQKRNELCSSLPGLSFNYVSDYQLQGCKIRDCKFVPYLISLPEQLASIFLETKPFNSDMYSSCDGKISKSGGYPSFPKNFNIPQHFKDYKFYLQLNVKEIFGKSVVHGGILPYKKGMLYFFIDENKFTDKSEESDIGNCVKLLFFEDYNDNEEFTVCKDVKLYYNNDYERIVTKVHPSTFCFSYEDKYYPGHYYEYGYWKNEIVDYFKYGILPQKSSETDCEITHALFCPHLFVPYSVSSGEYGVDLNVVLLQNLNTEGTSNLVVCDLVNFSENLSKVENEYLRWESRYNEEGLEKLNKQIEKREEEKKEYRFQKLFSVNQKEETAIGWYVVKEEGRYYATTE
ncbi:hypothetical protein ABK040_006859 [Willaertia magna]